MNKLSPRKINELDYITGKVIREFKSMQELTEFHDVAQKSVDYAIKNNKGYMPRKKLRFVYGAEKEIIRKVEQIDYFTGEHIEVYNSANAAALDNFLDAHSLRVALKNNKGMIHKKQLRFRYVD